MSVRDRSLTFQAPIRAAAPELDIRFLALG